MEDFSGGPVVKNPLSIFGDVDLIPDLGIKILPPVEQLSLLDSPVPQLKNLVTTTQDACVMQWRPTTAKINK